MDSLIEKPTRRRLRILSFDPSLATQLATSQINEITVEIPWEDLEVGPVGEYVEVVDVDPASGAFYHPLDLNDPFLLARDGLAPSESNPQFHQQMVYAVAMITIRNFERALGRVTLWSDRRTQSEGDDEYARQFVRRLRIYPHALRDRNAYYSPAKKAVLFGYFPVTTKDSDNTPGTIVHTCLSHDIIAHEVTHALLDGVHPRFNEPTNPDVRAFHEAFADIIALFQHFSYPEVLENQVSRTRGKLDSENLLAQLAQQFGKSTGRGTALRDALGERNRKTDEWELRKPNPRALDNTWGPHERGSILVAAVFRAFLLIYRSRSADLFRIATQGTGTLPDGDIHPDLTKRLASEAAWSAQRALLMCIRAIDYCPPVNITFGEFLRGIVTAEMDYAPGDRSDELVAFLESFREWGIHPRGVSSMGIDALTWPGGADLFADMAQEKVSPTNSRVDLATAFQGFIRSAAQNWNLESDRFNVWLDYQRVRKSLRSWLRSGDSYGTDYARLFGLVVDNDEAPPTVYRDQSGLEPTVEIHSARPALRRTRDGATPVDLVIEITQRRRGYFDPEAQERWDGGDPSPGESSERAPDFIYRAGCTVLVNPRTGDIRRVIRTHGTIADNDELSRVRDYLTGEYGVVGNAFDAGLPVSRRYTVAGEHEEPFALLHRF